MKKFFYILSVLVCLLGVSVNAWANNYYKIRVVAVYASGETPCPGKVFSYPYSGSGITYSESLCVASEFTTPTYSTTGNPDVYICAADVAGVAEFLGWYTDPACTTPAPRDQTNPKSNQWGSNSGIAVSTVEAEAPTTTFYAKFVKPSVDWTTYAAAPSAGKYYIFGLGYNALVGTTSGLSIAGTKETNNALLFTFTSGTTTTMSCVINGTTYYLNQNSNALEQTDSPKEKTFEAVDGGYNVNLHRSSYSYWEMEATGRLDYENKSSNTTLKWLFIPEATFNTFVSVESLNENGSVTITESPTASGTAYVKFNVSEIGPTAAYNYALSGGDGNWVLGNPTRSGNVLTVPVTYTAQNVHPVGAASTVTVTVTDPASNSVSGTATAYVDLQPTFNMAVSELDWSYDGEDLVETYYVGMEIAASQRERLQNKLVYNASTTNAIAKNNATWTATITGEDAEQFKFANGTREVSGSYTADLMDVIFAPQATGEFTATLHVVVNYEDANHTNLVAFKDVTLKGKGELKSLITFAVDGSEESSNNESHNFGDIIGTNSKTVTADLFMVGLTSPTKVWSDPAGVFEFDESSIDFSEKLQTLTFRAHRTTPIETAADHTATLTISGTGTEGPVSAVLTLTYHALPLTQTTVTWNWATLGEYVTATNPITTNSDGAWTLTKTAGDAMTYDAEAKSVTTDYLHHEPGHTGTFSLSIPQTDTYTAFNQTYTATIDAIVPPVIEINSQEKFDTYVEGNSWVEYDAATNAVSVVADNVYFKWSGQSTFAFDFYMSGSYESSNWKIKEMYKDGTVREIYNGPFYNGQHHEFAIASNIDKLWLNGNNDLRNVRYFEYDTIAANYEEVVLLDDDGSIGVLDVNVTTANKKALTVSLNSAAQPYFELRATGKSTGSSITFDGEDGLGVHKTQDITVTIAAKAGLTPAQVEAAKTVSANNECKVIFADNYTYNQETLTLPIRLIEAYDVTYKKHAHGTYKVTYADDTEHPQTVSSADFVKHLTSIAPEHTTVTISAPTPAAGYKFQGWKINGALVSFKASITKMFDEAATVEPIFELAEGAFKIDAAYFDDLTQALNIAGSLANQNPVIVLMKDTVLSEPATYTIPAGVSLFVPYKANNYELQTSPEHVVINSDALEQVIFAYRTLTLKEGVNIVCNGNICVGGKIASGNGGRKSAYVSGECGVINMVQGGHIEVNNGGMLYCWGFIKGQDMDQGNNTVGTGTVTANSGATIWEDFELGDFRGGTASSNIYFESEKMLFPFQSYSVQNVEIPTTYKYGSVLNCYLTFSGNFGNPGFVVSIIGPEKTLFLLTDENSQIRKWYDPTTDLSCYELNGTAELASLIIPVPFGLVDEFNSADFNLPISNSMHVILADCNMTLTTPLTVQAGAVLEIKNTATVDLKAKIHLFDVDEWGLYIHNYYFRSFNNLTSHKNRGAENSKAGLDDAKFIIDGTLNVKAGEGYIYSTTGGANLMGNGGGVINFEGALPSAGTLWQVNVLSGSPYITWVENPEAAANLHNEDGSYTKSSGFTTYYNINGRWFYEDKKDPIDDHTYDFYYLDNGNTGDETWTAAVYSHDKTGLTAGMKWFNVEQTADDCTNEREDLDVPSTSNWWMDTRVDPVVYYNYTMLNEWHQFIETETENVYSCSNNVLYTKDGCNMVEAGFIDENCLYTIGGVKKALVDGHFIPLISNGYDPAYHNNDESKYYICFSGCNWHEATPYPEESKAYTIHPEDKDLYYIWFNNDWMNVEREEPFFYTADEQTNVKTYYEYVNGDWVVATPFVRVEDALETREFYMIKEAFNVASIKKDVTITILRDIPNVTESLVYTTQNTTCTLDLNGHIVTGSCNYLLDINAPGSTFTITDNSTYKNGELRACPSGDARRYGYKLTAGTLKLVAGKMYSTNTTERKNVDGVKNVRITGMTVANGATFTMEGGDFECIDEYNNIGIEVATGGVVNMKGGRVYVRSTVWYSTYGIYLNRGTLNMSGGTVESSAAGSDVVYGVYVNAAASYNSSKGTTSKNHGTLNLSGGSIIAESQKNAYGVYVHRAIAVKSSTDRTFMAEDLGVVNMTGGSVTANATTATNARGIYSFGTVTISGGTITANVQKSTQNAAYGMVITNGNTTISGTASITANAPTKAYGIWATADVNTTYGYLHQSNVTINGGTINANATNTTTAYAVYVNGNAKKLTSGNFQGDYAYAGTVTINNGILNANAKTTTAAGVYVVGTKTSGTVSASPTCTINCGKFKMTGTATLNGVNGETLTKAANFKINGGIYSHEGNLATYANAEANKIVVTLPKTDANYPDYKYEVAEGYTITFKNGEETLQATAQKSGTTPTYNGVEPTKDDTDEPKTKSYIFDGWSTTDGGDVVALATVSAEATYFAHFNETTLKHRVTLDAQTNGGVEETQIIYVDPASAIGTLPTATKAGYTFQGWFSVSAATGGDKLEESTEINADATYYARFTINQHTLTWNLNGGKVTTAGTAAAKDAEGSPSGSVDYKANITAPVVAKTGYTFKNWGVAVAATMPDNDLTYTAVWTPKTNTAYTVKHFKQNLDGTYPAEPADIDELTGTTEAYVTPAVKTYDGFISPSTQTAQITGNGAMVVSYQYARRTYTIAFDANGGELIGSASRTVRHGATLGTLPGATKDGANCIGWFTKAIGGDQITESTVIQRNIGTLYAQYDALNVIASMTISEDPEVTDLRITTTGSLTMTVPVSVKNFILESNGSTASGQFLAGSENLSFEHAYFDLKLNAKNHQWYPVAVPWPVNATNGISVKGRTLTLGVDFDIIYYDGARRAAEGKQKCWQYVQNDGDQTLVPGRLYMIGLMGDAAVVRFEMKDGALLTNTTSVAAHPQSTGDDTDAGWNGVANPALFHAFVNPGVTEGQVFVPDENRYELIPLNTSKFVVGEGAFVQVASNKDITVVKDGAFAAPRRVQAQANLTYDVRIAPVEADYTDRLFIKTTDSRDNMYTVGQDLAKVGVSSKVAQMWIDRYDAKLCVNTAEWSNNVADYPLGISVPANGEYTIHLTPYTSDSDYTLYLTYYGEAIWNLSEEAYTLTLEKGTTNEYGLRIVAKAPQVATGVDEALIDAQGKVYKVMINNQIFIIRGNEVYTIDGQMVK